MAGQATARLVRLFERARAPSLPPKLKSALARYRIPATREEFARVIARVKASPPSPAVIIRVSIALAVIAIAVVYLKDRLLARVSLDGVVNAPLISVRAPIDGVVQLGAARIGNPIAPGTELFRIVQDKPDVRAATELQARLKGARELVQSTQSQIDALMLLMQSLEDRVERHRASSVERLGAMVKEAQASLDGAHARETRARNELKRVRSLKEKGNASIAQLEEAESDALDASADVGRLAANLERLRIELAAAGEGTVLGEGYSDVPYSQQRMDEITVRLAELNSQRDAAVNLEDEIGERLQAENDRLNQLGEEVVESSAAGMMWGVRIGDGIHVSEGELLGEVADCSNSFVEATLPEHRMGRVRIGDPVKIKLKGSGKTLSGHVRSVRGSGTSAKAQEGAAQIARPNNNSMTVVVAFDTSPVTRSGGGDCEIGRSAQVFFK